VNLPHPPVEPELICKDLRYINIDQVIGKTTFKANDHFIPIDQEFGNMNFIDEIKKEKKALGGPMFSVEENERLRREKLRGGYYKENSSESSNNNSDPNSPNRENNQISNSDCNQAYAEEQKLNNANKTKQLPRPHQRR